ncbi:penicillin-binding protein 2 [Weissella muntiaci]|uniref:Penicillin-binding protein 2 n=1 Tax=Weissella muntiaci TaxID=2508881 RepID=A0A6C2C3S8_9LACO|nr:penicillin-binding protein 2 [Weissella muntiaci]TYC48402.1 penicillin-binding protein 2 [Weissella muntiaci]
MKSPEKRRQKKRGGMTSLSRIPARLNILMGVVVVMLGALAFKAYTLQIANYSTYKAAVSSNTTSIQEENVRRGEIVDSSGKLLVSNTGTHSIQYTKPQSVTDAQMYKVANNVGKFVSIETTQLSDSNYAGYYILDAGRAKAVAKKAGIQYAPTTDTFVKQAKKYVVDHKSEFPLSNKQVNNAMIFQKMTNAYALSTVQIKTADVTDEEIAAIGERQSTMPGINVGMYYTRAYPAGDDIKSLIGTEGKVPDDSINQLLSQGYSRDDMVGVSFLEKQYEAQLKGTKKRVQITTDPKTGETTSKTVYSGKAGSNLILSLNSKLQDDVRTIIKNNIPSGSATGGYAVVLNPKTGGIYAMVGVDRDNSTGDLTDNDAANVNKAQVMGSVVKPAMITTGLMQGVITPSNNTLTDQPIKIAGTASKSSWFNTDGSHNTSLTASEALEVSSNSYVMQLMLKMGGLNYSSGMSLSGLDTSIFSTMRNGLARFGMGVKTGIDLPGEISGLKGSTSASDIGLALDESFGQYDTFTTIQLAQYVATIANGGYRVQPHLVEAIQQPGVNGAKATLEQIPTRILGTVGWTEAERNVIWNGMNLVSHGSSPYVTGGSKIKTLPVNVSMKTGTAETFTNGVSTTANTAISFVPNSNVAVAVVFPDVPSGNESNPNINSTYEIWEKVLEDVEDKDTLNASANS